MSRYTLQDFIQETQQQDLGQGLFELETDRVLEINLNGMVWTKMGSMISYLGNVKFTRERIFEQGIGGFFKKAISGEGCRLTKAEGSGKVYLADYGKKITILNLKDESIWINGNDVLAFETSIAYEIKMMKRIGAMISGGLFNVKLTGTGMVAFTTYFNPVSLMVTPDQPVYTDPNATVAWSGDLMPKLKTDMSLKTFFGRGSGESFQNEFTGSGFVVIQPFEEGGMVR